MQNRPTIHFGNFHTWNREIESSLYCKAFFPIQSYWKPLPTNIFFPNSSSTVVGARLAGGVPRRQGGTRTGELRRVHLKRANQRNRGRKEGIRERRSKYSREQYNCSFWIKTRRNASPVFYGVLPKCIVTERTSRSLWKLLIKTRDDWRWEVPS